MNKEFKELSDGKLKRILFTRVFQKNIESASVGPLFSGPEDLTKAVQRSASINEEFVKGAISRALGGYPCEKRVLDEIKTVAESRVGIRSDIPRILDEIDTAISTDRLERKLIVAATKTRVGPTPKDVRKATLHMARDEVGNWLQDPALAHRIAEISSSTMAQRDKLQGFVAAGVAFYRATRALQGIAGIRSADIDKIHAVCTRSADDRKKFMDALTVIAFGK